MFRNNLIAMLVVLGMTVCGAASSAIVKYNFSQSGFDDGAIVTGMFAGEDLNGDGFLVGNEGVGGFNEVTDFNMEFSGNSIISAFTLGLDDLVLLAYDVTGDSLLGSEGGVEIIDVMRSNASEDLSFIFGEVGTCGGNRTCGIVFRSTEVEPSFSFELMTENAVPLPATVWLFGSGLLGLFGMARIKVPTESKKA
jgi:hypothetical protein